MRALLTSLLLLSLISPAFGQSASSADHAAAAAVALETGDRKSAILAALRGLPADPADADFATFPEAHDMLFRAHAARVVRLDRFGPQYFAVNSTGDRAVVGGMLPRQPTPALGASARLADVRAIQAAGARAAETIDPRDGRVIADIAPATLLSDHDLDVSENLLALAWSHDDRFLAAVLPRTSDYRYGPSTIYGIGPGGLDPLARVPAAVSDGWLALRASPFGPIVAMEAGEDVVFIDVDTGAVTPASQAIGGRFLRDGSVIGAIGGAADPLAFPPAPGHDIHVTTLDGTEVAAELRDWPPLEQIVFDLEGRRLESPDPARPYTYRAGGRADRARALRHGLEPTAGGGARRDRCIAHLSLSLARWIGLQSCPFATAGSS